jgi:hypothetical protein
MAKHEIAPNVIAEALALRQAGFTVLAISHRLSVSIRSLQRHFAANKTSKGAVKAAVFEQAKADLLARVTCDATIKDEAARLIADDLAHSIHLREIMLTAAEQLKATNLSDAALVMRAAAAYSTAIKNTSDTIRRSLRLDKLADDSRDELPELVIRELTPVEILALRDSSEELAEFDDGDDVAVGQGDDTVIELAV